MQQREVNDQQLEVLAWISAGCPEGVMKGFSYKTSAIALRSRGLVNVSKRGGWHASITDAGRHFLEHKAYPGEPAPMKATPTKRPKREPRASRSPKESVPAGELGAPPESLSEPPTPPAKPVRSVLVPARLSKPHAVITQARDEGDLLVSKNLASRALRIAHALALAFEEEGWRILPKSKATDRWNHPWSGRASFVVDTGEYRQGVYIGEENDRTEHVLTAHERKQKERYGYSYAPKYEYKPSGRLHIEIPGYYSGRRQRWGDRKRWAVEEKLAQIVDEIEARSLLEQEDRMEHERKEAERRLRIRAAIDEATVLLQESHRKEVFLAQVQQWHEANHIRDFLTAMASRVDTLPQGEARLAAEEWMRWCCDCTKALDPLEAAIGCPEEVEPTAEALRPFLPDWMRRSPSAW